MPKPDFRLDDSPVLRDLLVQSGVTLVDIGGRGGALSALGGLGPAAHYFICEPDAAEAARLAEELPRSGPWRAVTVMTEAMASRSGDATLHVTRSLGMTSLLEPDPAVANRFYLADRFEVAAKTTVSAIPLDVAARRYGFLDACFLKLDTQGTELDILASGDTLVADAVVGVHVESCFQPFYRGQSLFSDVDGYLRTRGFSLFSLSRTALRRAGFHRDVYSRRIPAWAHCLYLREPAGLADAYRGPTDHRLLRLLALALSFQHLDVAFEVVGLLGRVGVLNAAAVAAVTAEVEATAVVVTRHAVRRAERLAPATDDLLSPAYRDRKRIE